MGYAEVEIRKDTVLKVYPESYRDKWEKEVLAYQTLSFAAPKLVGYGEGWLGTEKLTPILDLPKNQSIKYRDDLRKLIIAIHNKGYWHGDIALCNVVIHPTRGVLLIDWENLMERNGCVSYDLYGSGAAGVDQAWEVEGNDGVSWNRPWDICPGKFWKK